LVEPDDALADYYTAALSRRGHRVSRERDQDSAAAAATLDLDIVVIHVVRPPPAGTASLALLRARAEYHALPMVVLTTLRPEHFPAIRRVATEIHRMPFPLGSFPAYVEEEARRRRVVN
jgi:DNA-binding response OmpR family regulator